MSLFISSKHTKTPRQALEYGYNLIQPITVQASLIELCVDPPEETGGLPLTHYELRIQTHPRGPFHGPFAYLPGRRVLRLPHLIPGMYYRFALSAVSAAGRGPNAYLQVTTNRLSKPAIRLLTAPEYIKPNGYNVHWNVETTDGVDINQYNIKVRPVEIENTMGEISSKPLDSWNHHENIQPSCDRSTNDEQPICSYHIDGLKPNKAYELEISGRNSMGFSESQRVIFRTPSEPGANGQVLNMPLRMAFSFGLIQKTRTVVLLGALIWAWLWIQI